MLRFLLQDAAPFSVRYTILTVRESAKLPPQTNPAPSTSSKHPSHPPPSP